MPLTARDESRLVGVEPHLAQIVRDAAAISKQPFMVIEGVRSAARQAQLYAQGRTAPGKIVTWVHVSNHQAKADGFGHAVDLGALEPNGQIDWNTSGDYDSIKDAMFAAAAKAGIKLRWGADWNENGVPREHGETDEDHFELEFAAWAVRTTT